MGMDDSYYFAFIVCPFALEPAAYICRYPNRYKLGLEFIRTNKTLLYSPWNTAQDAMAWVRRLTSQEYDESMIMHLRKTIQYEYKEYGANVAVTVNVENGKTNKIVGSFTYVPNPPH
jgi:hypothetical protein